MTQEAGLFEVVIPAASLSQPTSDPGVSLGQAYERVMAYADGVQCVSVATTATGPDAVLQLGLAGQPEMCSKEGAAVMFVSGFCHPLNTMMVLAQGMRETLSNLAPAPPGSLPPVADCVPPTPTASPPDSTPTPSPPPGGITPPDTGSAGLAAGR